MPNRIIKETIRTSKTVNNMTDFQFRIWVYLITYVDDFGRGSADPELIKGLVLPRRKRVTESDIEKALAELAGMGCIVLYDVDGESYFYFPNWGDHQRIQNKKSKYPEPTCKNTGSRKSTVIHGELPPESNPIRIQSEAELSRARDAGDGDMFDVPETERARHQEALDAIEAAWRSISGGKYTGYDNNQVNLLLQDYDVSWILEGITISGAGPEQSWRFVKGVLLRFKKQGGPDSTHKQTLSSPEPENPYYQSF